ncbi:hypothetical protein FSP39_022985 [Pinctada imbricata]|uniref:Uncharacterized protein n=1 Tax=Pinctada imbricata TaxID=66713 RepID=A0AA88XPE8_PINIB|nr:hypothetical protein FSP39_022985 [Pinctada imbricata]
MLLNAYSMSNYNEQYSRKTNFKVFGVQEREGEKTEELVCKVIEEAAGVKIQMSDIVACHRIPGQAGQKRPILVKMRNTECKATVMRKRSKVKKGNSGVKLVDDVTKLNAQLISQLNEHAAIESAWYFNGSVFGQYKGKRIKFDIIDDIDAKIRKSKDRR